MMAHPILINRPIVVTPAGVKLCRPSETVLDILPATQRGEFRKEDGELVVDSAGRRVEMAADDEEIGVASAKLHAQCETPKSRV